jgi:O-antigen ligase
MAENAPSVNHYRNLLFAAGFFTCTWDLLLNHKVGGFTLKLYQPLFLAAFLLTMGKQLPKGIGEALKPLRAPFALCILALAFFYMGLSPWSSFPLKSFLYSSWLIFDVLAVWLTIQHLARAVPLGWIYRLIWGTLLFLSAVILIDRLAFGFGYRGGLIGHNQEILLNLGLSRPHAFASEPSYAGTFLCLGLLTSSPYMFRSARRKWLVGAGLQMIVFALVATTSRTGFFGILLGAGLIALLPVLRGRRLPWRRIFAAMGLGSAALGIFFLAMPAAQREATNRALVSSLVRGTDSSGNDRLKAHIRAFEMAKETHGLGTGMAASYRYFLEHGGSDYSYPGDFSEKHYSNELIMSTWGQLLAEGGPVAVLLYLAAGIFLTRALYRRWKREESGEALGSFAAGLVCFFFIAFWLGNVCRGDLWVWYGVWSAVASSDQAL